MINKTIEIQSKSQLRSGVPLRFNYRGYVVSRGRTGHGGVCFWSATSADERNHQLTGTLPTNIIDRIDEHLGRAA